MAKSFCGCQELTHTNDEKNEILYSPMCHNMMGKERINREESGFLKTRRPNAIPIEGNSKFCQSHFTSGSCHLERRNREFERVESNSNSNLP